MKYSVITYLFSFFCVTVMAQTPAINDLRSLYGHSIEDQDKAEAYYALMQKEQSSDGIVIAYKGAAASLMSKHVFSPLKKLDYLAEAKVLFEQAVKADPRNPEIRLLRYSYQHYVPGFLGYSGDLESDRTVMLSVLRERAEELKSDKTLFVTMVRFLLDSKRCEPAQDEYLRQLLSAT
jgi:hypothetical protein